MNDESVNSTTENGESPESGDGANPRKEVMTAGAYYAVVIGAFFLSHWFTFKVEPSSALILIALVAPFIVHILSFLKIGTDGSLELKVREIKHEVHQATSKLSREVSETRDQLNSKFDQLARRSQEYLRPQPLELSDAIIEQLRQEVESNPITDDQVEADLASPDPAERIIAYAHLQNSPDRSRLSSLADCFFLEGFTASTQNETRPLWQLLVAVGKTLHRFSNQIDHAARVKIIMAMQHCLEWLEANPSVDPGGECKNRLRLLMGYSAGGLDDAA